MLKLPPFYFEGYVCKALTFTVHSTDIYNRCHIFQIPTLALQFTL